MLSIKKLKVNVENKNILNGICLDINPGEVHAIMGPNGSGKSTLSATIAGQKSYVVTEGEIIFKGKNLLTLKPEERAGEGIFVAFQYPVEIPGVNNQLFLLTAINSIRKYRNLNLLDHFDLKILIKKTIKLLNMSDNILTRAINVGFSGGEKKRNDILQMILLEPTLCILDETDSGLDIDAVKIVSNGINMLKNKMRSFIIITHYKRILECIKPDFVHVLYQGNIIKSGDLSLVQKIEEQGYGWVNE